MERLRQYIYLAQKLDASLSARIEQIQRADPERAKVLQEDMLFYVRQKVQDLTTQLAVSVQGYLALDVIRRNNLELIRGVDRATTTTVSALRTAVIVAQALSDQKLVLDQITALNTTTSNLIESTSVLLRQQSTAVNEQAASATVDIAKLQAAFDNIYATMDEIDAFKLKALDSMSQTVDALTAQIGKAQSYLDRAKARDDGQLRRVGAVGAAQVGCEGAGRPARRRTRIRPAPATPGGPFGPARQTAAADRITSARVRRKASRRVCSEPSTSAGSARSQWRLSCRPGNTGHVCRARSQTVIT